MDPCPSRAQLEAALDSIENGRQEQVPTFVSEHIEHCALCNDVLLSITEPSLPSTPTEEAFPPLESDFLARVTQGRPEQPRGSPPTIEGYCDLVELGRGGMGVVYRAKQESLERTVALKVILFGSFASDEELRRFREEAKSAADLVHAHIVQVYEINEYQGRPYFALEFVPGGSLHDFIQGTPQNPHFSARIVETLARTIHYAHQRGIVHRDLKPRNILLTEDQLPKISDFGLAKRLQSDGATTATGAIMGTPSYMAPEQAEGKNRRIGQAADIYALGAVLYACLTGRPPFLGETHYDTLKQVLHTEPVPPRKQNPEIPLDLDTICLKCLEKSPQKRYRTAEELAADLNRFLSGNPIHARPATTWEHFRKWVQRNPAVSGLLLSLVIVFLLGFAGVLWQWRAAVLANEEVERRGKAELVAKLKEFEAQKEAAAAREEANRNKVAKYLNHIILADRLLQVGNIREAEKNLSDCSPTLRNLEWYFLKRRVHFSWQRKRFKSPPLGEARLLEGATCVAFSPKGIYVASVGSEHAIRVWDSRTGRLLHILRGHSSPVTTLAFSRDGSLLASGDGGSNERQQGEVRLWDLDKATERCVFRGHQKAVTCVTFHPMGHAIASSSEDGTVRIWQTHSGKEQRVLRGNGGVIHAVAYSPDGELLAAADSDFWFRTCGIKTWEATSGMEQSYLRAPTFQPRNLAFTADGKYIAACGSMGTPSDKVGAIQVFDLDTGQAVRTFVGHSDVVTAVAFSADGSRLLSAGGEIKVWAYNGGQEILSLAEKCKSLAVSSDDTVACATSKKVVLWEMGPLQELACIDVPDIPYSVAFGVEGKSGEHLAIGTHEGTIWLWSGNTGNAKQLELLGRHKSLVRSLTFSSKNGLLASACEGGVIRLWDLLERKELRVIHAHKNPINCLAFSPESDKLASGSLHEDNEHIMSSGDLALWEVSSGKELLRIWPPDRIQCVAFDSGGTVFAGGDDKSVRAWNTATKQEILHVRHENVVNTVIQTGKHLIAAGDEGGLVQLWHVKSGKQVRALLGHKAGVRSAVFEPLTGSLVSASWDGVIKVWDPINGIELLQLVGHRGGIRTLAASAHGTVASASDDGTVRIWDIRNIRMPK